MPRFSALAAAAASAFGAAALWCSAPSAGQTRSSPDDPLQVVADVVLIEAECRGLAVDYGRLYDYAARNDIRPVDILPLGERRAAFEAATRRHARDGEARLCGPLARERAAMVPGVFTAR